MVKEIIQDAAAIPILLDWLGEDLGAVYPALAIRRARTCIMCTQNMAPGWWNKNLRDPIAKAIIAQLKVQETTDAKLPVDLEREVNMCRICGCCLKLKVWTPIRHIADHTSREQLEQYPDFCWIAKEIKGE
jgi:hypothetical protein